MDVIGNRGGKAFGAVAQQLMFQFISPSIGDLTHEIFAFFSVIIIVWLGCAFALSRRFVRIADHANH